MTTRSKRDFTQCNQSFDNILEEAEKTRSRLAKERRKENWLRSHPPVETLPYCLLPHILSYLDSCKDLYTLSLCSKSFRQAITPEMVVRSAIFQGEKAQ